jgi:hypothetical protein
MSDKIHSEFDSYETASAIFPYHGLRFGQSSVYITPCVKQKDHWFRTGKSGVVFLDEECAKRRNHWFTAGKSGEVFLGEECAKRRNHWFRAGKSGEVFPDETWFNSSTGRPKESLLIHFKPHKKFSIRRNVRRFIPHGVVRRATNMILLVRQVNVL